MKKFNAKLALTLLAVVLSGASAQALDRTVSVTGTCLRSAIPDRGSITVVSDFLNPDLQVSSRKATESYETVKKAIQKLNLKDVELSTSEYSVNEIFEYQKDKQVSKGFRARMGLLVVTSETGRLGEVIAIAAKAGVKDVGQLRVYLSDDRNRTEREVCLETAIQNAQSKAQRMAKAAGAKLGKVISLNEEAYSASAPSPMPMFSNMMKSRQESDGQESPTTDVASQKLQLSVQAVFQLD